MNQREGRRAPLSYAERRAVRRAVRTGDLIPDPIQARYAMQRVREARFKIGDLQARFETSANMRRLTTWLMTALGAAVLLSGLSSMDAVRIVIGAADMGLGVIFLLLAPFARRGLDRLSTSVRAKEHTYSKPHD